MRKLTIAGIALVVAAVVWGACAYWNVGGQRQLFHDEGRHFLNDYYMPWKCANEGYRQPPELEYTAPDGQRLTMFARDRCYPAFAILPHRLLPFSVAGGIAYSLSGGVILLLALVMIAKGRLWPLVLAGSMPFIHALERGNSAWFCAVAIAVFLAWWDDESKGRRTVAAVCLAVAALLKITPAALGLLYLFPRERGKGLDLTSMSVAAGTAVVLFVLPWLAMPNGFSDIPLFLAQARENGIHHIQFADFGLIQLWRAVRVMLGQELARPWSGMIAVSSVSQAIGFAALVFGAFRRRYVLMVGGLLLAAGNMHYYGALYLLPVFVLEVSRGEKEISWTRLLLWAALLCPFRFAFMGHGVNFVLGNLAVMALMGRDALE